MILPTAYFPSILQFALAVQKGGYTLEKHEHFLKQTFRNRCEIYGANSIQKLVIPLKKWGNHTPIHQIEISYAEDWQKLHWRSIESAYSASAYFEFFRDELEPFYQDQSISSLLEWNKRLEELVCELAQLKLEREETTKYEPQSPDYRILIHPKKISLEMTADMPSYWQVFQDKHGFHANLSIIDLLFNLGPATKSYLNEVRIPF